MRERELSYARLLQTRHHEGSGPVFRGLERPRLAAALLMLGTAAFGAAGCRDARPRNLLLISLDTLRADHLGCYGYGRPTSPFLDSLAAEGVVFDRAFSAAPWTLPSHASLFTGLYPSQHGVKNEGFSVPKDVVTLPQSLAERGFATAAVVSAHFLAPRYGLDRGFERYIVVPTNPRHGGAATTVSAHGLAWLAKETRRPFFLFLHYMDIHSDYAAAPRFEALFSAPYQGPVDGSTRQLRAFTRKQIAFDAADRSRLVDLYDAEIRQLDAALESLFAKLREQGALEHTLVVVTADHGEELFEHGGVLHGQSHYQELLHVPLILVGPGLPKGVRIATPVSLVDLAPTLLALFEAPAPPVLAGRDLAPLWRSGDAGWPERDLFAEADRTVERRDTERAVIHGNWKLVLHRDTGARELYDLSADPHEQVNLADTNAAQAAQLADELTATLASEKHAPELPPVSDDERRQLQALGYVGE
jgi:arylsulfatase A-like enzyme